MINASESRRDDRRFPMLPRPAAIFLALAFIFNLTLAAGVNDQTQAQTAQLSSSVSAPAAGQTVVGRLTLKRGSDPSFDLSQCAGFVKEPVSGRRQAVAVGKDGTFTISGLAVGIYDLSLDANPAREVASAAPGAAAYTVRGGSLARVRCRFVVTAVTGQPMDLGAWELEIPRLVTGKQTAPAFKCLTMDNNTFSLRDCRGKYVMVEFWASWCGFCKGELPYVKKIHEEFGADPRFVMISLSVDKNLDQAQKYVAQNQVKWVQGILGNWALDQVSLRYGVHEIPTMFLIGPEGRIIDKQSSGKAMRDSIALALGKNGGQQGQTGTY